MDTSTGLTATNVASISAADDPWDAPSSHTCAITTSGQAYCWGYNAYGQIGDNSTGRRLTPTPVNTTTGLTTTNVAQISAGNGWTCAVTTAGQAYCWGHNYNGELGSAGSHSTPYAVDTSTGLTTTNVARISAGVQQTCAVTTAGQAYCWGANGSAQLGDGTKTNRATPTAVNTTTGLTTTNVAQISAGWGHTCAVTTAGQAYCWGDNETIQTGNNSWSGPANPVLTPTAVVAANGLTTTNVASISAGYWHTCATTTAGRAYCWGQPANGQLGNNSSAGLFGTPSAVDTTTGLTTTNIAALDTGDPLSCFLTTAVAGGTAYCSGYSTLVGDGTSGATRVTPTPLATTAIPAAASSAPTGLAAGSGLDAQVPLTWSSAAGAADYQVQWRTNGVGGWTATASTTGTSTTVTGLTNNTAYEFQVRAHTAGGFSAWSASVLATPRQWAQLSAGITHTCAVTVSGRAYCWGEDTNGQIGDGISGIDRKVPVPVDTTTGLTTTNVASISTGQLHTCAVTTAGALYCWGNDDYGQIGDNTTGTDRLTPTAVDTTTGLTSTNVAAVTTGTYFTCARTTAGRAYCWGADNGGQIGDNTTGTNRLQPTAVDTSTGLTTTNVARISAGGGTTCAVTTTGRPYCWGWNDYGAVGDNTTGTNRLQPTPVDTTTGLTTTNVAGIEVGDHHTCAVTTAGAAYCWGNNASGQVGDNTSGTNRLQPTAVNTTSGLTATTVAAITAGASHSCAVTTAGAAYCWGDNISGQIGDNTSGTNRLKPTAVNTTTGLTATNVVAISSGGSYTCALGNPAVGGTSSYCWGVNGHGQVGDNTSGTNRLTPKILATTAIPAAPATPTGLAGTSGGGTGQVPLTWTSVAGTDYQIQYRVNGSGGWTQTSWQTAASLTVTGLTNGTTYDFQVRGHNAGGYSAWSASVTATP